MKKVFLKKSIIVTLLAVFLPGCQNEVRPSIVPAIEVKKQNAYSLGTIGEVEPVYMLPIKSPFPARIDTGATNSSIDAVNIKTFERDGEKWVSFNIINRETKEKHHFEKPVEKETTIVRIGDNEKRIVVLMDIKIGKETITERFSLAHRKDFEYQALIGRNILTGRALVDTSCSNTLY